MSVELLVTKEIKESKETKASRVTWERKEKEETLALLVSKEMRVRKVPKEVKVPGEKVRHTYHIDVQVESVRVQKSKYFLILFSWSKWSKR